MKLIERARILKSANSKVPFAADLVASKYEDGHRWLVYCDSRNQLTEVGQHLNEANVPWLEYTSAMAFSREETIRYFEERGGVLLAIECLDEGVDIPSITHALVLASSTNPRQHLQRRGRVLRTAPDKSFATIYDTLVAPYADALNIVFDQDLTRAKAFAQEARNRVNAEMTLNDLGTYTDAEGEPWRDFEEEED
jgi:superfamily II DNA or RNA helicase